MIVEITEDKIGKMSEYAEKMLRYGGKLMSCLDGINEEHGLHHRGYGDRYGEPIVYGGGERIIRHSGRMNYRDHEGWDDMDDRYDDDDIHERRRRSRRTGRYM